MKRILFVLITILCLVQCVVGDFVNIAMEQPGVDMARGKFYNSSCMIALQPSTSATIEDMQNAVGVLISEFGRAANATGYTGKLQIGITDRPGRVIYMLTISAKDAMAHVNDPSWLVDAFKKGEVFQDDTRNYDPYGNRYTPFPEGKGLLGSMVMPWLGYVSAGGNKWFDPDQRRLAL